MLQAKHLLWAVLLWAGTAGAQAGPTVPIEAFTTYNKVSAPRLSPDGRHLSFTLESEADNYSLIVVRVADMQPVSTLKFARYELPVQTAWVDSRRLVIAKGRKAGSLEKPSPTGEIISTDLDGTNRRYVYGPEAATRNAGLDRGYGYIEGLPRVPNGHFYMRALSVQGKRTMLYDVDTEKSTHRLVADIPQRYMSFAIDPDGKARYAYGTDEDDVHLLYEADERGNWTQIPSQAVGGRLVPFSIRDDGRVYAWLSREGGPDALVLWSGSGQEYQVLASDGFASVGNLQWTPTPRQPFAADTGAGVPVTTYFEPASSEAQLHAALAKAFPGQTVDYVDHSTEGSATLLYVYSDRNPGAWYLFDRQTSKLAKLLVSRERLDPAQLGHRVPFRFTASDGLELAGFMTLPPGVSSPAGLPMVLLPHGGPHAPGDAWAFDTDAQFLASRGYLVLQVNYRGSQGRGRAFEEAGYLKWGTRIQDDLIDGVRWAIAQGHADPARICVYGASFGAYSAMMTSARAPGLFRCAAGFAGIYDLRMMYSKGDIRRTEWGRNYLQRVIGRSDEELAANSPTALAGRITVPVLLIHGEEDQRAPLAQAVAMRKALESAGRPPEYLAVPKEGHGFFKDENNVVRLGRLEAFLARHLGRQATAGQ